MKKANPVLRFLVFFFAFLLLVTGSVFSHCDGMDGPVIKAAKRALDEANVNFVLIWVQKKDEGIIREVFQKAIAVRKLSPEAKQVAEMYFFETLVRIHRAGEGAPYTGLKPAGRDLGPAIPAADKAIEDGSADEVVRLLNDDVRAGVLEHFKEVNAKKNFKANDVEAGREYVKTYVEFIHYVERIFEAITKPAQGHFPETEHES